MAKAPTKTSKPAKTTQGARPAPAAGTARMTAPAKAPKAGGATTQGARPAPASRTSAITAAAQRPATAGPGKVTAPRGAFRGVPPPPGQRVPALAPKPTAATKPAVAATPRKTIPIQPKPYVPRAPVKAAQPPTTPAKPATPATPPMQSADELKKQDRALRFQGNMAAMRPGGGGAQAQNSRMKRGENLKAKMYQQGLTPSKYR